MEYIRKILLVDDEPSNLNLLKRITQIWDLESDLAHDGLEAINRLEDLESQKKSYPVICTDLTMPRMCGIELTKTIHQKVIDRKILPPIILTISGYHADCQEMQEHTGSLSAWKHYRKPCNLMEFGRELKEFYDRIIV